MSYPGIMNAETTESAPSVEEIRPNTLTNADRCDTCGAQAFVVLTLVTGDLLLCGHHFSKGEEKIRQIALHISDERWKINVKPSASSPD